MPLCYKYSQYNCKTAFTVFKVHSEASQFLTYLKAIPIVGFTGAICIAPSTIAASGSSQIACVSRRLSRLYGIHPPSIWGFLNFIFRGVRAHPEPTPFYAIAPYTTPADQASRRYIMRNSYRDVAYHCSEKQRNPITGWQLNSLCRGAAFQLRSTKRILAPSFARPPHSLTFTIRHCRLPRRRLKGRRTPAIFVQCALSSSMNARYRERYHETITLLRERCQE